MILESLLIYLTGSALSCFILGFLGITNKSTFFPVMIVFWPFGVLVILCLYLCLLGEKVRAMGCKKTKLYMDKKCDTKK